MPKPISAMATVKPFCVFCNLTKDKILSFTQERLDKCAEILNIRQANNLQGKNVKLPSSLSDSGGYHSKCLSNFTALKAKYKQSVTAESEHGPLTEPSTSAVTSKKIEENEVSQDTVEEPEKSIRDDSFVVSENPCNDPVEEAEVEYKRACIFCNLERKKHQSRWQNLHTCITEDAIENMKSQATELNDLSLLLEIASRLSQGHPILYHHICIGQYNSRFRSHITSQNEKSDWHKIRETGSAAFEKICSFVEENIIGNSKMYFLDFLEGMYVEHLAQAMEAIEKSSHTFSTRYLEERLLKKYPKQISVIQSNKRKIVKPYAGVALEDTDLETLEDKDVVQKAALILRKSIRGIAKKGLPEKITVSDLIKGECTVPDTLTDFYITLLSGGAYRRKNSPNCQRLAESFSEDVIQAVSNGTIMPSKHIVLGLTLKALTNSKKIVNIINRYGHCSSYSTLQGLETEATFSCTNQSDICPEDVIRSPNLCTGLAFNNFDRFVDTASGKDTLHDTVGIIFQDINDNAEEVIESNNQNDQDAGTSDSGNRKKRRRSYDVITHDLESYTKKPRITGTLSLNIASQPPISENLRSAYQIDKIWMLSHALQIANTPMWVGFNSLLYHDTSVQQKISYLTTINNSPTSANVVLETLVQCQKAAEECGQSYMQVTYDLGIAKTALQLQCTEKPRFDNLFIHIGSFHIMMAYFKAIGKYIDNCGLTNIMVDSELLANGSVNGFITGKHFNRGKRLHPLACLAIQILHFESFTKSTNFQISDEMRSHLQDLKSERDIDPFIHNEHFIHLLTKYEAYEADTLAGAHGKTPQYFLIYANLVHHYLTLNRSIRSGDFEMFKLILPKITNLFFTFNQQNYSRYLVKYCDNLENVDETHPGLKQDFEKGTFGIRRTSKPFSRQPIDLTLEQTINADAANKLTGVIHTTNSISARQRWCKSHSIKAKIITHVMEKSGLRNRQDITADLKKSYIEKTTGQLKTLIANIEQNVNPFSSTLDKQNLYNISSGQAVDENVAEYLLNVEENGNKQRETFITECAEDENRFEKPIKRNKIYSFVDTQKKKMRLSGKVVEVRMQRDLFGRLLGISLQNALDLAKILSYPLTPVPLSLCHIDGTMCKTDKSALLKLLENIINKETPPHADVQIFDGFFMLHLMREVPLTFGNISSKILQMFMRSGARTVVVTFDEYVSPSIKDNEHSLRGTSRYQRYHIKGADQTRPADFSSELKNINFKEALVKFIIDDWKNPPMAPFLKNRTLYVNYKNCYRFEEVNDTVVRTEVDDYACIAHEEADTKVIFHACKAEPHSNVVIRCSDTDILVIALGNMEHLNANVRLWLQVGVGNSERFINVTKLYDSLGPNVCKALPGFHAFTGCDFNPAFFKKGKRRPFTILRNSPEFMEVFSKLHNYPIIETDDIFETIEKFVCCIYGCKQLNNVNEARLATFMKAFKCNDVDEQFKLKAKNFDGSILPPCKSELRQQILRSAYISSIWSNAHLQHPTVLSPADCGWQEIEEKFEFRWFEGDQLPASVSEVVVKDPSKINDADQSETQEDEDTNTILNESDDSDDDACFVE